MNAERKQRNITQATPATGRRIPGGGALQEWRALVIAAPFALAYGNVCSACLRLSRSASVLIRVRQWVAGGRGGR